jgi:hypothetical protein
MSVVVPTVLFGFSGAGTLDGRLAVEESVWCIAFPRRAEAEEVLVGQHDIWLSR